MATMERDWLTYLVMTLGLLALILVYRQPREAARRRGNLLVAAGMLVVIGVLALLTQVLK